MKRVIMCGHLRLFCVVLCTVQLSVCIKNVRLQNKMATKNLKSFQQSQIHDLTKMHSGSAGRWPGLQHVINLEVKLATPADT